MSEIIIPSDELYVPGMPERITAERERWQDLSLEDVRSMMPAQTNFYVGNGVNLKAAVIPPQCSDPEPSKLFVRISEYQQQYTPGQYMSAVILRNLVEPNATLVMLQNNSLRADAYSRGEALRMGLRAEGLHYLAKQQMSALEQISGGAGTAIISGWSVGANMALAMAGVESDIEVTHVNADEVLSQKNRDGRGIARDFKRSGSPSDQRQAVIAAGIPAFYDNFSGLSIFYDYAKFGLAYALGLNRTVLEACQGTIDGHIQAIKRVNPNTRIKIGRVAGSFMCQPEADGFDGVDGQYCYQDLQRHATVNDPFAQAQMALDCIAGR